MPADADPEVIGHQLDAAWPAARCELEADDPWGLLMAVICSTRTTDDRVNMVLPALLEQYPLPSMIADEDPRVVDALIARLPLHLQKARALVECGRAVAWYHDNTVPRDLDVLVTLPGVGRKIAAVVAGNAYQVPAVAADVHVIRAVHRWGWVPRAAADVAETAITQRWPAETWVARCHRIIRLGRHFCRPQRPFCSKCPLQDHCPRVGVSESR